jgi:hypothetical protein
MENPRPAGPHPARSMSRNVSLCHIRMHHNASKRTTFSIFGTARPPRPPRTTLSAGLGPVEHPPRTLHHPNSSAGCVQVLFYLFCGEAGKCPDESGRRIRGGAASPRKEQHLPFPFRSETRGRSAGAPPGGVCTFGALWRANLTRGKSRKSEFR